MKNVLLLIFAISAALPISAQGKLSYEQKMAMMASGATFQATNQKSPGDLSIPQTNEPVTADMLNCPMGVYRSYEDFVNKKAEPLEFSALLIKGAGGLKDIIGARFKNSSNKEVTVDCGTMWGFKTKEGKLYRTGTFFYTKELHILFEVEYVSDYVFYHPYHDDKILFKPFEWCSSDLKSPVLESKYYFSKYTSTRHDKVEQCQNACEKKAPRSTFRWYKEIANCELSCADIRFVYVAPTDTESGGYKAGGMQ